MAILTILYSSINIGKQNPKLMAFMFECLNQASTMLQVWFGLFSKGHRIILASLIRFPFSMSKQRPVEGETIANP